ncbi:MAG TPA: radical SAM protein, partial [Arenibaculum sp.]|nr:radical SAM protein [Arenibaculum sp.]
LVEKVRLSKARVVGISLIYRPQVGLAIDLLEGLREIEGITVVAGGALASFMPRELLSKLVRLDAIAYGEAEETFRDLCTAVVGGGDWHGTRGIAFRDGNVPVINGPAAPLDLAKVMRPTRDTLAYLQATGWPTRIASMYTSRGCMAKCTFCTGKDAYNVERMRTYRFRSSTEILDEIQHLREAFGVRFVYINDDNFLGYGKKSYERVREIAEGLLERNLGIQFATECRVDGLDVDLLKLLKEAGMRQVLLGIESGSTSVLQRWRKGATVEQNREAIEMVSKIGVALEPGFIMFDAHTRAEELEENLEFIRTSGLERTPIPTYLVNRLSVYPGTEIERLLTLDGVIAPSGILYGAEATDDPKAIIDYFQRLEYVCADRRTEIGWRSLRAALEPVEKFLEDQLPLLTNVLTQCRGPSVSAETTAKVRDLIRRAVAWRRNVGRLVTGLVEECIRSYSVDGHARQMRWLRQRLAEVRDRYDIQALGMSTLDFAEEIVGIHRSIVPMELSVVIPSVGKWSRLRRTIECLGRQRLPDQIRWELILVLDGVTEPLGIDLDAAPMPVRVVRLPERRGRGAARNAGIRASRAETVVLLDDDILVGPDFLAHHLEAQKRRASLCHGPIREVPALVYVDDIDELTIVPALAGRESNARIRSWAGRVVRRLDDPMACWDAFGIESRLERDGVDAFEAGRLSAAWVAFAGANLSAPKKWFLEAGFDERPGAAWGLEDLALALSWSLAGRPLSIAGEARGLHLSHYRSNWQESLRGTAECMDYLPPETVEAVLGYLESKRTLRDLEQAIDPYLKRAQRREKIEA